MGISVSTSVARFSGAGTFSGSPTVITSAPFTPGANSLVLLGLSAFEANANRMTTQVVTDSIDGATGWAIVQQNGSAFNGGGTNSEGYCAFAWKKITHGSSITVSGSFSWQDDFSGNPCSVKPLIITGQDLTTPIGLNTKAGPSNVQTISPGGTVTGAGRLFFIGSEQNGGSGSAGAPTSTDTADLAYVSTALGTGLGYKATDHAAGAGSVTGNLAATATTFWNWSALEILAAAGGGGPTPNSNIVIAPRRNVFVNDVIVQY